MVAILNKLSNGFAGHANGISKTAHKSTDPQAVLDKLTLEQKITLLSGADHWHTAAIPSLGIPKVRTSDGPVSLLDLCHTDNADMRCRMVSGVLFVGERATQLDISEQLQQSSMALALHAHLARLDLELPSTKTFFSV